MTLFFTAVNQEGKARSFMCSCENVPMAMEILGAISLLGDLFINVELMENDKRIQLPAEALDRTSFSISDHQLKNEWQHVLNNLDISVQ